ncbi:MAG TPA: tRNA (adenosine(37)-N6)-threonylcarbamoyltransferase complex dimerization subunit type 1 TsaB [Candidatus Limnocylindria bacterium]|nr:tRNA (adenosine(37)-N6)-threonylcarbamoyltransferase complex dimerization subunit type 1 TsaB [Candidatus Limnocylindria bacterium]
MILTIRTDKPEAEIGLFDGRKKVAYQTWQAHRQLAETIHQKMHKTLSVKGRTLEDLEDVTGVVVYKGPGSFTGLRIGMSVANALAYSLDIPIVATAGDDWIAAGITSILANPSKIPVMPKYGSSVHTTQPRK